MGRRDSKSGRGLAGNNLWGRDSRERDQCGKNDLLNRGLRERKTGVKNRKTVEGKLPKKE